MEKIVSIQAEENTYDLHVMWSLHNKCNYKCNYCPDELNKGTDKWLKFENLKGFIQKIEKHYVYNLGKQNILFSFTGGEPTLWKDFKPFIKYLNSKGFRCGVTTNAHISFQFWEDISDAFDYICLSFHPHSADLENFLNTFQLFHDKEKIVTPSVRIMMPPDDKGFQKSKELVERLKDFSNYSYECVHLLQDYGLNSEKIEYKTQEQVDFINKNAFKEKFNDSEKVFLPKVGFNYTYTSKENEKFPLKENELIAQDRVDFRNWKCAIGLEQLFIHFSGVIKSAGCSSADYLGNIIHYENISFPSKPTICKTKGCYCPTDIRITKTSPQVEFPNNKIESINSPIKGINTENTVFDFFMDILISNNSLTKGMNPEDYITYLKNFVQHIKERENILDNKKILLNIKVDPTFNNQSLLYSFFHHLETIPYFKTLNSHPLRDNTNKIEESIFKQFNYIYFTIMDLEDLNIAKKYLQKVQVLKHIRLELRVEKNLSNNKNLIEELLQISHTSNYFELTFSSDYKLTTIQKYFPDAQSRHIYIKRNPAFASERESRLQYFTKTSLANMENGDSKVLFENEKIKKDDFKDWMCFSQKTRAYINGEREIYTSHCSQNKFLGFLDQIIFDTIETKPIICNQKNCGVHIDRQCKKTSIS